MTDRSAYLFCALLLLLVPLPFQVERPRVRVLANLLNGGILVMAVAAMGRSRLSLERSVGTCRCLVVDIDMFRLYALMHAHDNQSTGRTPGSS